MASSGKRLQCD